MTLQRQLLMMVLMMLVTMVIEELSAARSSPHPASRRLVDRPRDGAGSAAAATVAATVVAVDGTVAPWNAVIVAVLKREVRQRGSGRLEGADVPEQMPFAAAAAAARDARVDFRRMSVRTVAGWCGVARRVVDVARQTLTSAAAAIRRGTLERERSTDVVLRVEVLVMKVMVTLYLVDASRFVG